MRKIMVVIIFTSACVLSDMAFADECKAVQWPYANKIREIRISDLQAQPRGFLYQYLYFELSSEPKARIPGLAKKLFFYLKNTELNYDKNQMIQAFEWVAALDSAQPQVIPIAEICAIQSKINRKPSSNKSSPKKTNKKSKK